MEREAVSCGNTFEIKPNLKVHSHSIFHDNELIFTFLSRQFDVYMFDLYIILSRIISPTGFPRELCVVVRCSFSQKQQHFAI